MEKVIKLILAAVVAFGSLVKTSNSGLGSILSKITDLVGKRDTAKRYSNLLVVDAVFGGLFLLIASAHIKGISPTTKAMGMKVLSQLQALKIKSQDRLGQNKSAADSAWVSAYHAYIKSVMLDLKLDYSMPITALLQHFPGDVGDDAVPHLNVNSAVSFNPQELPSANQTLVGIQTQSGLMPFYYDKDKFTGYITDGNSSIMVVQPFKRKEGDHGQRTL